MKKKTIAIITCLVSVISLSACGSKSESSNSDIKELQNIIEELEEENSRLKEAGTAENANIDKTTQSFELETWDDDYVISFVDEKMRERVIEITGVSSRDITYGDVKNMEKFEFEYDSTQVSIENFKYFTGIKKLDVGTTSDNLNALVNCQKLERLILRNGDNLADITALANCPNLTSLSINRCDGITDISALANCSNLISLSIDYCDGITDISALANCSNLTSLNIDSCNGIMDISALANCSNLTSLSIDSCNGITDISALANCSNLTSLSIDYCEGISKEALEQLGISHSSYDASAATAPSASPIEE